MTKQHSLALSIQRLDLYQHLYDEHLEYLEGSYIRLQSKTATLYHRIEQWDSDLFNCQVGKVEDVFGDNEQDIDEGIDTFFQNNPYDYVLVRVSQHNNSWIQKFEKKGAIFLDSTIDLSKTVHGTLKQNSNTFQLIDYEKRFEAEALDISQVFHYGRFFTDPFFKQGKEAYKQWVKNSLNFKVADGVKLLVSDDKVHGLISYKVEAYGKDKILEIPLVGKHPQSDVAGVASLMLHYLEKDALELGCCAMTISTQGTNTAGLRSYIGAGFKPYHAGITMRWKKN